MSHFNFQMRKGRWEWNIYDHASFRLAKNHLFLLTDLMPLVGVAIKNPFYTHFFTYKRQWSYRNWRTQNNSCFYANARVPNLRTACWPHPVCKGVSFSPLILTNKTQNNFIFNVMIGKTAMLWPARFYIMSNAGKKRLGTTVLMSLYYDGNWGPPPW